MIDVIPANGLSTVCRICKKEIARASVPLDIPLDGQPDFQALQYLGMLDKHLKKRHPENAQALSGAAMEFGAMLLIHVYQIDDPSVTARADLIRDSFVNQFAPNISDAEIDALIERIMSGNQSGEKILHREQAGEMARGLRDLLTCRGPYAPKAAPEASTLIHP